MLSLSTQFLSGLDLKLLQDSLLQAHAISSQTQRKEQEILGNSEMTLLVVLVGWWFFAMGYTEIEDGRG